MLNLSLVRESGGFVTTMIILGLAVGSAHAGESIERVALGGQFDEDGDGKLSAPERSKARGFVRESRGAVRAWPRADSSARPPKPELARPDVKTYGKEDLFAPEVVRTAFIDFPADDWEAELRDFFRTDVGIPAKVAIDGRTLRNVGVKFADDHSTLAVADGLPRPLELDLNENESGQDFRGATRLLLHPGSSASKLAAAVFSTIAAEYSLAPKVNFINVVIGGRLWGAYLNYEAFGKDFVDDRFGTKKGERWFAYPGTQPFAPLESEAAYKSAYDLKSGGEGDQMAWDHLAESCASLAKGGEDVPGFDIDQILWVLALERVFSVADGCSAAGGSAIFQGKDLRYRIISYGGSASFGVNTSEPFTTIELPPLSEERDDSLLSRFGAWRNRYLAHLRTIAGQSLNWDAIGPVAENYAKSLAQATGDPQEPAVEELRRFVEARRAFLLKHPDLRDPGPVIDEVTHFWDGGTESPAAGQAVTILAKVAKAQAVVAYVSAGQEPGYSRLKMEPGEDGMFKGKIPGQNAGTVVRYYVEARANGASAFHPAQAEFKPVEFQFGTAKSGDFPVRLNEVMPANTRTKTDPQGDFDDYVELYNTSDEEIDLSGRYLSDKSDKLNKWAFPEGTKIAPKGFLLVWVDEDGKDKPGLHASFKLSKKGENLFLVDTDENRNAVLDKLAFENLGDDEAFGRSDDSGWKTQNGSPGAKNQP